MANGSNRVAVIGLGAMGAALAGALLTSGATVRVWNRTAGKARALGELGAVECATPAEAILGSDTVVVCVSDYPAWRALADAENLGAVISDRTIVQLTTGTLDHVREHENWARQCGARVIDGSIVCFPSQIGTEMASLLVAGERPAFDAASDVLTALASDVVYLGDNVDGPVVLDMALLSGSLGMIVGIAHGAAICRGGGVEPSRMTERLLQSWPIMTAEAERMCRAIESGDTVTTEASLKVWGAVPADLQDLATRLGIDTEVYGAFRSLFQRGVDRGLGDHDVTALVDVLAAGR